MKPVEIVEYKWSGKWGPFKIKTHCKECDIIKAMLESMHKKEFKGKPVKIKEKPWLDNWIYCIFRGAFHTPIVMVNGKTFHQFSEKNPFFNRKKLADFVFKELR